jgi:hypothetical protein
VLTYLTVYTLRRLARHDNAAVAPQEVGAGAQDSVGEGRA